MNDFDDEYDLRLLAAASARLYALKQPATMPMPAPITPEDIRLALNPSVRWQSDGKGAYIGIHRLMVHGPRARASSSTGASPTGRFGMLASAARTACTPRRTWTAA